MGARYGNDRPDADATGAGAPGFRAPEPPATDQGVNGSAAPAADGSADPGGDGSADRSGSDGPTDGAPAPEPQQPAEPERSAAAPQYPPGPQYPVLHPPGPSYTGPYTSPPPQPRGRRSWGTPAPERTHRWGLGAYVVAEAVFLLVGGLFSLYFIISGNEPAIGLLVLGLAAPTVLAAGIALLFTVVRGNGPRIDLGLVWSWRDLGLGLAFGVGGIVLSSSATVVYISIFGADATSAVADVFGGVRVGLVPAVIVLIIVVFVAPLCEEILYRGLLWGAIERLGGRWWALVGSTLVFAVAHFEYPRVFLLPVVAIPIAIARLYTGRLLASIVAHQVNNLPAGIVLMLSLLGYVPLA